MPKKELVLTTKDKLINAFIGPTFYGCGYCGVLFWDKERMQTHEKKCMQEDD
jgi:hypothetical protein